MSARQDPAMAWADALTGWLRAHAGPIAPPLRIAPLRGGRSNPTYLLTCADGRRFVMRCKPGPVAALLPSAHAIEREYRVLHALRGTEMPVPEVVGLCEDESLIGRAFYVMCFVDGRSLWDPSLPGLPRHERAPVYDETNRLLAALHNLDVERAGLAGFGRPSGFLARQIERWERQWLSSRPQGAAADGLARLGEWLRANAPPSAEDLARPRLVHGDFRLDNLMFRHDAPRALCVLDWELSTLGHPLLDLAGHCLAWHFPPGPLRGIGGLDLSLWGLPDEAAYLRMYCGRTDILRVEDLLAEWPYYIAFGFFRSAGIVQGVLARQTSGLAPEANESVQPALVNWLVSRGLASAGIA
jgi:aminoglycoside phosphotransferase (APT) family kinase protein